MALQDMPRAHLGLNSFKGAYCSSVPSGWAERAASRLRPTSSSSAISCQPRALGVDCGLDPASARELRVLERLAADTGGEAQQGELLGTGVASLSLGSTGGAADSAWGDEGPSGNRLLGGDTREVAESWDDDVGEVSGCENGSPPTAPCAVRKPHHHEEAGRSSLGEGNEGGDSKAEDSIDSWGSDSAGDEGSGAPRRPPAVQVLVSELEVAGSMQEALEKAAARLAEACPRRPQQALLLSGVAALLEPGGASDLPGAAVRALSSTTLVRVAKALYDLDVVEEEAVMEWVEDMKTAARLSGSDGPYTLRIKQMAPFVKWLQEADGASSGDE